MVRAMRRALFSRSRAVLGITARAAILLAVPSCHEPEPTTPARARADGHDAVPDAGPPAIAASAASAADGELNPQRAALTTMVCKSAGCRVAGEEAAGTDAEGHKLAVVKVALAIDLPRAKCEPVEYWAVARDGSRIVSARRAFQVPCDASTADMTSHEVHVRNNEVERLFGGGGRGSAIHYTTRSLLRLSPLRLRSDERTSWSTAAPNFESKLWNFEDFAGRVAWFSPKCVRGGIPPVANGPFEDLGERKLRHEFTSIPLVDIEEAFRATKWRQVHLGKCAALATPTGTSGYVLKGGPGTEDDGYFRVVASPDGDLFIDVKDNKWTAPKRRGDAREDQLEIWTGGELPSFQRKCIRGLTPVTSFIVRVADGKVTAGFGKPDVSRTTVDRHAQTFGAQYGWAHFKIHLAAQPGSLTVVYRDGDDGRSVDRVLATSRLTGGDASTLGALRVVPRDIATCRVKDGNLEPVLAGD
jgi:hypothetical protein